MSAGTTPLGSIVPKRPPPSGGRSVCSAAAGRVCAVRGCVFAGLSMFVCWGAGLGREELCSNPTQPQRTLLGPSGSRPPPGGCGGRAPRQDSAGPAAPRTPHPQMQ